MRPREGRVISTWRETMPAPSRSSTASWRSIPGRGASSWGAHSAFSRSGQKDAALAAFQKAAELDPRLPDAHFHLAVLYQERGETEKSEQERRAFEALETIGENKTGF